MEADQGRTSDEYLICQPRTPTFSSRRVSFSKSRALLSSLRGCSVFTQINKFPFFLLSFTQVGHVAIFYPGISTFIDTFSLLFGCFSSLPRSFPGWIQLLSHFTFWISSFLDVISAMSSAVKEWDLYFLHSKLELCVSNWRIWWPFILLRWNMRRD